MNQFFVYIMTNRSRTLYAGVTNNLERRVFEHKNHLVKGFTSRYRIDMLIYYEMTQDVEVAIAREKQIKGWLRSKKIALIESTNPEWDDLGSGVVRPSRFFGTSPLRMTRKGLSHHPSDNSSPSNPTPNRIDF